MADQTAIHGEHGNFQAKTPTGHGIRIDIADVNVLRKWRERANQLSDEIVAKRALLATVDNEPRTRHRGRWGVQGPRSGAAGVRPVAMYFSVSGGTSPTTVT